MLMSQSPAQRDYGEVIARFEGRYNALLAGVEPPAPPTPWYSLNTGAAGIAYAFLRLFLARKEQRYLRAAERLIDYTADHLSLLGEPEYAQKIASGRVSLFHSVSGVHFTRALIKLAAGQVDDANAAAGSLLELGKTRRGSLDVTIGSSGMVVAVAILLDIARQTAAPALPQIREFACEQRETLEERLRSDAGAVLEPVNFAHGYGGLIYALLLFSEVTGEALHPIVADSLSRVCASAERTESGARWKPHNGGELPLAASWCNGTAGLVHTLVLAERLLPGRGYLEVAMDAAFFSGQCADVGIASICCGLAGQAYALLAVHAATGDARWERRARELAQLACRLVLQCDDNTVNVHALFSGELGVALLCAELEAQGGYEMPVVGRLQFPIGVER
jgi:eukaryotic-like serine/threonine-protein kinase